MSAQRKGKKQTSAQYAATIEKARKRREQNNFMLFSEFKEFVSKLDSKYHKARDLIQYIRENKPDRVPRNPYTTYSEFWISWNDLFGR